MCWTCKPSIKCTRQRESNIAKNLKSCYPPLAKRKMESARVDSLNLEAGRFSRSHSHISKVSWRRTLSLAFQSIGVIYGDIGTSPLYVYSSTFTNGIRDKDDLLGVLSLIIYTIILLPMLKYVFIVLWANDNGDGGTFALYSFLCRHAKVSMIPNQQPEDMKLSNYRLQAPSTQLDRASKIKEKLESSKFAPQILFLVTILGTSMVLGDGVLTPSISVLSAVGGIKSLDTNADVWISVAILIVLFSVQRFGTDKVGFTFAPIVSIWFLFISGIGLYNLFKHDIGVLRAVYPKYIVDYFRRNGKQGWVSLGGIILCITGTEAMFADLGHFNVRAVQLSFSTMVFPAIVLAYIGQTAYLMKNPGDVSNTFYASIPGRIYWPTFVVAVGAAVIASQAMISGAFAIISQSLSLGCFPRVKVIHTSAKYEGQVYIPEINYILMIACVLITIGFRTTEKIGNAYGIAVVFVMVITTCFLTLIMLVVWKTSIWKVALFLMVFGLIELLYLSSVLYKFKQGGYLPLLFSAVLMTVMAIWHYVHRKRYMYELENKISSEAVKTLATNPNINRVPGIGFLYSELVQGIPPIFSCLIKHIPSIHSIFVFISIKCVPVSRVEMDERFVFRQVEPRDSRMFRCVVRYGYNDANEDPADFERRLVEHLVDFIQQEQLILDGMPVEDGDGERANIAEEEVQFVKNAMQEGVVYLLGETKVIAKENSSFFKKIVVNYAYDFLRKNFRQGGDAMAIPHGRLLRVGMTYEI
ncbi:Potassium transporter 5 [Ancistrocladus abbreviatus]